MKVKVFLITELSDYKSPLKILLQKQLHKVKSIYSILFILYYN